MIFFHVEIQDFTGLSAIPMSNSTIGSIYMYR